MMLSANGHSYMDFTIEVEMNKAMDGSLLER